MKQVFFIISFLSLIIGCFPNQKEPSKQHTNHSQHQTDTSKVNFLLSICAKHNNADSILFYANQAIAFADSVANPNQFIQILSYYSIGWYSKQEFNQSISFSSRALAISIREKSYRNAGLFANRIGICNRLNKQPHQAISRFQESLYWYNLTLDSAELSIPYISLGNFYSQTGRVDSAIYYYTQSFKRAENSPQHQAQAATALANLGSLYLVYEKNYEMALHYQTKGLKRAQKNNKAKEIITALNLIGATYLKAENPDSALVHFQRAINFNNNVSNHSLFYSYLNSGIAYKNKGDYNKATDYYQQAISCCPNQPSIYVVYGNIGNLYTLQEKLDSALWYLHQAEKNASKHQEELYKEEIYTSLATTYYADGQFQRAYEYSQKASVMKDSLFNQQRLNALETARARYRYDSVTIVVKELEIEKLKTQSERQQRIISNSAVLFLLASLGILIWYYRREKQRNQKLDKEIQDLMGRRPLLLTSNLISITVKSLKTNEKNEIALQSIFYFEAKGKSTLVYCIDGKKYWLTKSFKQLLNDGSGLSNQNQFIRIHKSYIVNLAFVTGYRSRSATSKRQAIVLDETKISHQNQTFKTSLPLGDTFKMSFFLNFQKFVAQK